MTEFGIAGEPFHLQSIIPEEQRVLGIFMRTAPSTRSLTLNSHVRTDTPVSMLIEVHQIGDHFVVLKSTVYLSSQISNFSCNDRMGLICLDDCKLGIGKGMLGNDDPLF
jgi:hypothetical protein